jgi:hypothetical protein
MVSLSFSILSNGHPKQDLAANEFDRIERSAVIKANHRSHAEVNCLTLAAFCYNPVTALLRFCEFRRGGSGEVRGKSPTQNSIVQGLKGEKFIDRLFPQTNRRLNSWP